jgi:ureidoacrylate peracid hydrolase
MHKIDIPQDLKDRVIARGGKLHPFDELDPSRTALVVIDMQNYFVKPGYQGEIAAAREIVPTINRFAAGLRALGGHVVWIKNSVNGTRDDWSVFHTYLQTKERADRRFATMTEGVEGHELWAELDARPEDKQMVKKRFSAFLQGSSEIVPYLRGRGIDTVVIAGTATNICCESSARDAMMLNFKTIMLSDANATWTDEEHNATLQVFYSIFGDVQTADECLGFLGKTKQAAAAA